MEKAGRSPLFIFLEAPAIDSGTSGTSTNLDSALRSLATHPEVLRHTGHRHLSYRKHGLSGSLRLRAHFIG
jgi:hypothetical protein